MATFSDSEFEAACSFAAQSLGVLELNNHQKESLKAITSGRDVFVSLPTGFGKLICFQSVPFAWDFLHRHTLGEDAQSILPALLKKAFRLPTSTINKKMIK